VNDFDVNPLDFSLSPEEQRFLELEQEILDEIYQCPTYWAETWPESLKNAVREYRAIRIKEDERAWRELETE